MSRVGETINRLCGSFTVREIMIPRAQLVCARSEEDAERLLNDYPAYDVLAGLDEDGDIRWYIERGSGRPTAIRADDVISADTSILDLASILARRRFCFVSGGQRVEGYVHFSDLNNPIVRIPFFVLIETLEQSLVDALRSLGVGETDLAAHLPPERMKELRARMSRMRRERAELDWLSLLSFGEVVLLARTRGLVSLKRGEQSALIDVRNRVCHAARVMVGRHEDVAQLAWTRETCSSILQHAA